MRCSGAILHAEVFVCERACMAAQGEESDEVQNQPAWLQEDGSMEAPGPANGDAAAPPVPQPSHERQVRASDQP